MILPREARLVARAVYCNDYDYYNGNCNSAWNNWVRWLVLSLIILAFFLIFVFCSCLTARRRRRQGLRPYYGTGWAGGHGPVTYNPHQGHPQNAQPYYGSQPAPPYSPPQSGYYSGGNNQFTPQQTGIELQNSHPQAPQHAYQPNRAPEQYESVYSPPAGPPPGKVVK